MKTAVVLAAGKGTRFKSETPKVLHSLCGKPMIAYLLDSLAELGVDRTVVVVGEGAGQVRDRLAGYPVEFVAQHQQLGTGHAVMATLPLLQDATGSVIVLYGDTPLMPTPILEQLFATREAGNFDEVVLTVELDDPTGYGRIVRDPAGRIVDIVEQKDASPDQKRIREINAGFVCFKASSLAHHLPRVENRNRAGEYYLTDMVKILASAGARVEALRVDAAEEILGINDRNELSIAEQKMRSRINKEWMLSGVTLLDPHTIRIDRDARIGPETVIYPGVVIEGATSVGRNCRILAHCHLRNAVIDDDAVIDHCSVVRESRVGRGARIGPFAHLRENSGIGEGVRIGNFVELKKSSVDAGSTAAHLTYLGDAQVGTHVNIGAGTITCNYDGFEKHQTVIEEGAFIGSGCELVAPVKIGKGALVAAGSTITNDVEADALAIARARQATRPGWAEARRKKRQPAAQPAQQKKQQEDGN